MGEMHESLPNPLPEDLEKRQEVKELLDDIQRREIELADPVPDDLMTRMEVEGVVDKLGQNEMPEEPDLSSEAEKSLQTMQEREEEDIHRREREEIGEQIQAGRSAQDILSELGGTAGATEIVGAAAAMDLRESAREEQVKAQWIERIENELRAGRSAEYLLEELGGYEEAVRTVGAEAAQDLEQRVKAQKLEAQIRNNRNKEKNNG